MGKHFDELSKSLASGVSRRASLKRFATGTAGALLMRVLPGRGEQVAASGVADCGPTCRQLNLKRRARRRCVKKCKRCESEGGDWLVLNGTAPVCV
jgi:hypothetical protein